MSRDGVGVGGLGVAVGLGVGVGTPGASVAVGVGTGVGVLVGRGVAVGSLPQAANTSAPRAREAVMSSGRIGFMRRLLQSAVPKS
jgi:hypothetical protein